MKKSFPRSFLEVFSTIVLLISSGTASAATATSHGIDSSQLCALMLADPTAAAKMVLASGDEKKQQLIQEFAELNDRGLLQPLIRQIFIEAHKSGQFPVKIDDPEQLEALSNQFYGMIDATLLDRGYSKHSKGKIYLTWEHLDQQMQSALSAVGAPAPINSYKFMEQFANLSRSAFRRGNLSRPLINGPESFQARDLMMQEATKEITYLTWALYDDTTGARTVDQLISHARRGIKVRMMVDGQTAERPNYKDELRRLESAGIEVIYWRQNDPLKKYIGQHRKMMIVDRNAMIMGGMNPGDVYSHLAGEPHNHWRDTDILVHGSAARDAHNIFARLWNKQVSIHSLAHKQVDYTSARTQTDLFGDEAMALIDHSPDNSIMDPIYLATLFTIRAAKHSVDIENAYVIATPSLKKELIAAIRRGVRVRILSNSSQSVDEPIVSRPIMLTLQELGAEGAEVYLRKGSTLHSKFMIVDNQLAMIGSYNHHPRSLRFEGESVLAIFNGASLARLTQQFDLDIQPSVADRILDPNSVVIPPPYLGGIADHIFFDQL